MASRLCTRLAKPGNLRQHLSARLFADISRNGNPVVLRKVLGLNFHDTAFQRFQNVLPGNLRQRFRRGAWVVLVEEWHCRQREM